MTEFAPGLQRIGAPVIIQLIRRKARSGLEIQRQSFQDLLAQRIGEHLAKQTRLVTQQRFAPLALNQILLLDGFLLNFQGLENRRGEHQEQHFIDCSTIVQF